MAIQEKIYMGNEKFLREQEHFCPECAQKLSVCKLSWTVTPKENTALREYHPDGFRYVLYKFKCVSCDKLYSQPEIARIEKAAADKEAEKLAQERADVDKMCKKAAKKVAKKMTKDIERDVYHDMKIKYGLEKPKRKPVDEAIGKIKEALNKAKAQKPKEKTEEKPKRDIHINLSFHRN